MAKLERALVSVYDKQGLEEIVKALNDFGVEIISTGGTARKIKKSGISVTEVSDFTGFPEMMDGRVKTLHPKIHAGILALRNKSSHMEELKKNKVKAIDMVISNLYPFEKVIAGGEVSLKDAVENIDIGGPSMLRSAAKNFYSVAVVPSPDLYPQVIEELKSNNGEISEELLKKLSVETFKRTFSYDRTIYNYLGENIGAETFEEKNDKEESPEQIKAELVKIQNLRYGENPHQRAAFYKENNNVPNGLISAEKLHGKELSFNNIMDLNSAIEIVREFDSPAVAVIKHNNPCGAATNKKLSMAFSDAWAGDSLSAFGSIVGFNKKVDKETAEKVSEAGFVECIIASNYQREAFDILSRKKNVRILKLESLAGDSSRAVKQIDLKKVSGGVLVQDYDDKVIDKTQIKPVTDKKVFEKELDSLLFAWKICKHVKSNAIVLAQENRIVGIGAGQMSRVDSVIIANRKAGQRSKGAVLASDAFFPKPDAIEQAYKSGIKAIIQPGGSKRDSDIIEACNKYGISMYFTGFRHFRH